MNRVFVKPTRTALFLAAMVLPVYTQATTVFKVHSIGDSLALGSTPETREYVRDFYGYGTLPGNTTNPLDSAYNPAPFVGWRGALQYHLTDAHSTFEVDMLGTVSSVSNIPDTYIDGSLNAAQFTTSDNRTFTYDPDNNAHAGWRIGGTYNLSNINGSQTLANLGTGHFVYTPGQLPFSTYDNGPIDVVGFGTDVINTPGGGALVADGQSVFSRGVQDHLPEMADSLSQANVVVLHIGINDLKNREDVEGAGATVTQKVTNGNMQARLYNLILNVRAMVDADTEIYVSNLVTVNDNFDWNTAAEAREAVEAFNESFRATYFGNPFQDMAGYDDAIAASTLAALDKVYLLNTHGQVNDLIGNGNYSAAISSDGLHWHDSTYDYVGEFFGKVIAENTAIPEPGSAALLGVAGLLLARRRRSA